MPTPCLYVYIAYYVYTYASNILISILVYLYIANLIFLQKYTYNVSPLILLNVIAITRLKVPTQLCSREQRVMTVVCSFE